MHEILASHGFGGDRLAILHGGMPQDEREKVKAAFQTSPKDSAVRILLATDAASEGIDLQNHCNCLIHLEIPYNPNVMEQRNGRIDRHGQRHKASGRAGRAAQAAVAERIAGGEAIALVAAFLERRWVKVLTVAHQVEADKPGAVAHACRTMDELIWSARPSTWPSASA